MSNLSNLKHAMITYLIYQGWGNCTISSLPFAGISRHNAFTNEMCHSIVFVLELADADDRVKVVVMTGAGKSYCAGADLSGGSGADTNAPLAEHRDGGGQAAGAVLRCRKRKSFRHR